MGNTDWRAINADNKRRAVGNLIKYGPEESYAPPGSDSPTKPLTASEAVRQLQLIIKKLNYPSLTGEETSVVSRK